MTNDRRGGGLPENHRSQQITADHHKSSIERWKYYLKIVYVNNIDVLIANIDFFIFRLLEASIQRSAVFLRRECIAICGNLWFLGRPGAWERFILLPVPDRKRSCPAFVCRALSYSDDTEHCIKIQYNNLYYRLPAWWVYLSGSLPLLIYLVYFCMFVLCVVANKLSLHLQVCILISSPTNWLSSEPPTDYCGRRCSECLVQTA